MALQVERAIQGGKDGFGLEQYQDVSSGESSLAVSASLSRQSMGQSRSGFQTDQFHTSFLKKIYWRQFDAPY